MRAALCCKKRCACEGVPQQRPPRYCGAAPSTEPERDAAARAIDPMSCRVAEAAPAFPPASIGVASFEKKAQQEALEAVTCRIVKNATQRRLPPMPKRTQFITQARRFALQQEEPRRPQQKAARGLHTVLRSYVHIFFAARCLSESATRGYAEIRGGAQTDHSADSVTLRARRRATGARYAMRDRCALCPTRI